MTLRAEATQYDVSADGRFLINTVQEESSGMTLLQNWAAGLQR